ncbi:hypothetical protein CPB86DRAFT_348376 [Serendipita vermifera]|nr:hypothetical protein CPB86DRAFT_348376 [Serendipita vermifera]
MCRVTQRPALVFLPVLCGILTALTVLLSCNDERESRVISSCLFEFAIFIFF